LFERILFLKGVSMLVLSRQRYKVICIGPDIEVTVIDIRGHKVRLGIKAPAAVSVDRREVRQASGLRE
jgi:carbon storage regulator